MSFCRNCGTENEDNAVFCKNWGQKIEKETQNTVSHEVNQKPQIANMGKKNSALIPTIISAAVVIIAGAIILIPQYMPSKSGEVKDKTVAVNQQVDEKQSKMAGHSSTKSAKKKLINIEQINSIIATDANKANISVCVVDVKNNTTYATNNAESSMSASALINIPILYTIAKKLENNECS